MGGGGGGGPDVVSGGGLNGDPNLDNMKSSPTTAPSTPQQQSDPHNSLEGFMGNFIPGEHVSEKVHYTVRYIVASVDVNDNN